WVRHKPHFAIVLIDADGDPQRRALVAEYVRDLKTPLVVAVAVQEFETWLIADPTAVRTVLQRATVDEPPEGRPPGRAKALLSDWSAALRARPSPAEIRRSLAATLSLDVVAQRCPSFAAFRSELRAVAARHEN